MPGWRSAARSMLVGVMVSSFVTADGITPWTGKAVGLPDGGHRRIDSGVGDQETTTMKLLSFRRPDGTASWGIAKNEGVIDLGARAPGLKHALWAMTSLAEEAARHADFRLEDVHFLPPIPDPDKILCVGLNYVSHIK